HIKNPSSMSWGFCVVRSKRATPKTSPAGAIRRGFVVHVTLRPSLGRGDGARPSVAADGWRAAREPELATVIAWIRHFCKNARQMFYAMHII
ncbi:hypothetical protein ACPRNU_00005, partial [Chromobacterium vaccinii]|uniref:hypothetical protein n=1 Tax=Chromobacterium vaccinii TaxID=1108595 RepID=UPI003C76EA7D